jgi:hypothetical protein
MKESHSGESVKFFNGGALSAQEKNGRAVAGWPVLIKVRQLSPWSRPREFELC